jgi:hypothetical protein
MKMRKGVAYLPFKEARAILDGVLARHPEARTVAYTRGYAVQYRVSGPYWPELEPCAWCGGETGSTTPERRGCANREGDVFCSPDHRDSSSRVSKVFSQVPRLAAEE